MIRPPHVDVRSGLAYVHHKGNWDAWAKRALPDEGKFTYRVDLVDEGTIRTFNYVAEEKKIRVPLETYTEDLSGVEMPDLAWFDR